MLEQDIQRLSRLADWVGGDPQIGNHTGIQIIHIEHVAEELKINPGRLEEYFTQAERTYCQARIPSYAGRLAGKHAVRNILEETVPWVDISIEPTPSEQPIIQLSGYALEVAKSRNIARMPISISHDQGIAMAFVMGVDDSSDSLCLGTDIASVARIEGVFSKHGAHFLRRIYSPEEIDQAAGDVVRLTEMWAGKEAVTKALGTGVWREGIAWTDIAILNAEIKSPSVHISGAALIQARRKGLQSFAINFIHDFANPMAFVVGR